MSYRSSGSRSGSGGARRPSQRRGSSDSRSGWQGAAAWDDGDDDYGRDQPRRVPSRAARPAGSRGREDWGDDFEQPYGRGSGDNRQSNWRGARGPRQGGSSRALVIAFAALMLVVVAAVVGVVVLPGRNARPTAKIPDSPYATFTPGATPTISDQFKVFRSDRSKYSISYPAVWNATSQERTTQAQYDYIDTFALQDAPSQLLVEQAGAAAGYTDQQLIQNAVTLAQQNGVTFTKSDTQTPTQNVGGATWARADYSVNANGTPVHMVILACHHGGRGYVLVLVSSAAEFGNDDQAIFEPMLASFVFL